MPANVTINFSEMSGVVDLAIRRVSAFYRFGLDELDLRDGGDFQIASKMVYSFWPQQITDEHREEAKREYKAWLVGNCLRELDQFYKLFQDKVWRALELSQLHEETVKVNHALDGSFAKKTNVAAKQEMIAQKLSIESFVEELNSLSLARNCLTHNAGLVRAPNDCNDENRTVLTVKWLGFDVSVTRGGATIKAETMPIDLRALPGEGEAEFVIHYSPRQLSFDAQQKISIPKDVVAELCMFYKVLCDKVMVGLRDEFIKKGIIRP